MVFVKMVILKGNCVKSCPFQIYIIRLKSGKHAMLSRLSSLSISSLKDIDEQADEIYLRTDPLVGTACLIQSYTQHVLKPHIDKESEHQRFFFKKSFYK